MTPNTAAVALVTETYLGLSDLEVIGAILDDPALPDDCEPLLAEVVFAYHWVLTRSGLEAFRDAALTAARRAAEIDARG